MSTRYSPKPKLELPDLEPGTMVGEYRVRRRLDAGGMGTVYAGIHPLIGKKVAIKLLHPHVAQNPENIQRFKQEASITNAIGDPGIVDIFSFGEYADGRYYFVMEYLKGERLLEFIKRQGSISGFAAAQLLRMLSLSMAAAHDHSCVHRDLKAENVFLVPSNDGNWPPRTKILDFGLAKLLLPLPGQTLPRTRQGVTLGTPYYMSPEQCQGKPVDVRSDIYALGILGYEMITGSLPFMDKDPTEVMHMHLRDTPVIIPNPNRPRLFDELLLGCMEKNPDDRPQEMREVTATLESIFPALSPNYVHETMESLEESGKLSVDGAVSRDSSYLMNGFEIPDDSSSERLDTESKIGAGTKNGASSPSPQAGDTASATESAETLEKIPSPGAITFTAPTPTPNRLLVALFSLGLLIGFLLGVGAGRLLF